MNKDNSIQWWTQLCSREEGQEKTNSPLDLNNEAGLMREPFFLLTKKGNRCKYFLRVLLGPKNVESLRPSLYPSKLMRSESQKIVTKIILINAVH